MVLGKGGGFDVYGIPALGTDWRQTEGKVCCHAIILPKKGFKIIMSIHYQFERK